VSNPSPRLLGKRPLAGVLLLVLIALTVVACGTDSPESAAVDASAVETTVVPTTVATTTTEPPTTTTTLPPTTTTTAPPAQVAGSQLRAGPNTAYVLGDSVTLGAQTTIPPALAGWSVTFDAKESRRIDQGTSVVQSRGGSMGRVLVVHLCTNWGGGDYTAAATKLLGSLNGVERVVWVTCTPWLPAVAQADEAIRSLPGIDPRVVVADWAAISGTPGYTYSDGLHLQSAGAAALAQLVATAMGPAPAAG
jgi:hypothetical protein